MKKKIWFFILIVFAIRIDKMAKADNKINSIPPNTINKLDYIKTNFRAGIKYKKFVNDNQMRTLMIGNWDCPPNTSVTFEDNGKFTMIRNEFSEQKITGKWDIKNNTIILKYDDSGQVDKCKVKFFELQDLINSEYYNYLDYRYSFQIVLDIDYYWGGSFELRFK